MIQINRSAQQDGYNFSLRPVSAEQLRGHFPDRNPLRKVFIAFDTKSDFDARKGHASLYEQIAQMLTDLSGDELRDAGGFEIVEPVSKTRVFPNGANA